MFPIQYKLSSSYLEVRETISKLMSVLKPNIDEVHAGSIELCLAETLNNVVEHAYRGQEDQPIQVTVDTEAYAVRTTITDWGVEKPDPKLCAEDLPAMDLPEGGFGTSLIETLSSHRTYERRDNCNITTLWFDQ